MPWAVKRDSRCPISKPFAVVKETDGAIFGCHASRGEARAQQAALYAREATKSLGFVPLGLKDFNPDQPRWPRGHPRAGQWRPKLGAQAPRRAQALDRAMAPIRDELARMQEQSIVNPSPASMVHIGQMVDKVARRFSTAEAYEKRDSQIEAQVNAASVELERISGALGTFLMDSGAQVDRGGRPPGARRTAERDALLRKSEKIREHVIDLMDERFRLKARAEGAQRDAIVGVLEQIRPMGGKLSTEFVGPAKDTKGLQANVNEAQRLLPRAWIDAMNEHGTTRFDVYSERVRAMHHFRKAPGSDPFAGGGALSGDSVITVDTRTPRRTYLHEIGHRVQQTGGGRVLNNGYTVRNQAQIAYLFQRTGQVAVAKDDPKLKKIADIYPGQGYDDTEVTIPDKFRHAYYGKMYGGSYNGEEELLTMALEDVYYSNVDLRKKDPETLRWMLGMLATT